jgi:hypothetical protein
MLLLELGVRYFDWIDSGKSLLLLVLFFRMYFKCFGLMLRLDECTSNGHYNVLVEDINEFTLLSVDNSRFFG